MKNTDLRNRWSYFPIRGGKMILRRLEWNQ